MKKELKIGLIVAFLAAVLIWGINFLKGKNIFSKTNYYYALYDEVGGMEKASPVYLNGYKIGMVETINLTGKNNQDIIVKFAIQEKIKIPVNSKAIIYNDDLMGTKAIKMDFTDARQYYQTGDTVPSYFKVAITEQLYSEIQPIKTKAEQLIGSMDSIMAIFNAETRKNVRSSLTNLQKTSNNLNSSTQKIDLLLSSNSKKINRIIQNTDSLTQELAQSKHSISRTANNMASISDSLKKANITTILQNLEKTLSSTDSILNKINNGEGTAGMLVHNDSLYRNLNATTATLNKLLKDIEENPGRYINVSVFGKNR
jgi:phospholipid/cholesterol/gamma-HCH transport system substrate-binding protein